MTDPQIVCPNCSTSIKLTESLAAPLVAETKRRFERSLRPRKQQFGQREARLRQAEQELAKSREAIDERVATQLRAERSKIAEAEAKRARLALADELGQRDRRLAEMQQILAANSEKLARAQKAQADVLRKERELEDARREVDLTIEKKVQESLVAVRDKARLDAEEALRGQGHRKGNADRRHAAPDRGTAPQGRTGLSSNCRAKCSRSNSRAFCAAASRAT